MNTLVRIMSSTSGRVVRVIAGAGIITYGSLGMTGTQSYVAAAIGALPIMTGVFDICLLGPLLGTPLRGKQVRSAGAA